MGMSSEQVTNGANMANGSNGKHDAQDGTAYKTTVAVNYSIDSELRWNGDIPPASYPHYLPHWEHDVVKQPPLEPFVHVERGVGADPTFKDLLGDNGRVKEITSSIGAKVTGVQLTQLDDKAKDQLALLVAQKKVVVFRDQDFVDLPVGQAVDYCRYFGRLLIHPHSGQPEGHPEVHIVHRRYGDTTPSKVFDQHTHSIAWHTDVPYEVQPPGTTFMFALDAPPSGGDTVFVNTAKLYERLSPAFRQRLHGLRAVHSAHEQTAKAIAKGGIVRRDPIKTEHPIVRTHPATGEKSVFVEAQFARGIVGYKAEESSYLLGFLAEQMTLAQDLQCRVKWKKRTVVLWDNRVTAHSALIDWEDGRRRHLARITPQAERPYETPFEGI